MYSESNVLPKVLKFVTGESQRICRLCLTSTENNGVYLEDVIQLKTHYLDKTISYLDMLTNVINEELEYELPFTLCTECAENVKNSYLFLQLCEHSKTVWNNSLDALNKSIDLSNIINKNIQTVYLTIKDEDQSILTSKCTLDIKNQPSALNKLNNLIKRRTAYEKSKKNKSQLPVICQRCGVKLSSNRNLRAHMKRVHSDKKYPCKHCTKIFSTQYQLNDHVENLHLPRILKCPKCPQMLVNQKMLTHHDKTHHTPAICKICFVQFPSKKLLRYHMDKHDMKKCPQCDKEFLSKQSLRQHFKICIETDKLPKFFCDLCNKGYTRKKGLRGHLRAIHGFGQPLRCDWCDKLFDSISQLKSHAVKHTKEKNYHCDQCGGKFVTQASLTYHVRLHTGEKPFPCDLCDESFLSASRRAEHKKRKHIGPTKECTICSSKFVTKYSLTKHMERHRNPQSKLFVAEEDSGVKKKVPLTIAWS